MAGALGLGSHGLGREMTMLVRPSPILGCGGPLEQGQVLAAVTPGADLIVLSGAGHISRIEDERAFLDVLLPAIAAITFETAN